VAARGLHARARAPIARGPWRGRGAPLQAHVEESIAYVRALQLVSAITADAVPKAKMG
jgi:hypothetical protein